MNPSTDLHSIESRHAQVTGRRFLGNLLYMATPFLIGVVNPIIPLTTLLGGLVLNLSSLDIVSQNEVNQLRNNPQTRGITIARENVQGYSTMGGLVANLATFAIEVCGILTPAAHMARMTAAIVSGLMVGASIAEGTSIPSFDTSRTAAPVTSAVMPSFSTAQ